MRSLVRRPAALGAVLLALLAVVGFIATRADDVPETVHPIVLQEPEPAEAPPPRPDDDDGGAGTKSPGGPGSEDRAEGGSGGDDVAVGDG